MALVAHIIIGCIDCLAHGTIFTCAMFCPKKNLYVFFHQKARDEHWEEVYYEPGKAVIS
jgi:hypothetical protein